MLRVEGLTKRKPNGEYLFEDFDLCIEKRITTITGASGRGKTTLLKCIAQLEPYESGEITLLGETPHAMGIPTWRSRVIYVPQRPPAVLNTPIEFYDSVKCFKSNATRQKLDAFAIAYDWGISKDLFSKRWNALSGGEIQRITLAIAISLQPELLLLDEPTSALDPNTTLLVEKTLKEYTFHDDIGFSYPLTCVVVTHNIAQVERLGSNNVNLGDCI